jgi:hypothetical protein
MVFIRVRELAINKKSWISSNGYQGDTKAGSQLYSRAGTGGSIFIAAKIVNLEDPDGIMIGHLKSKEQQLLSRKEFKSLLADEEPRIKA